MQSVSPGARRFHAVFAAAVLAFAGLCAPARSAELSVPYVPTPVDVVNRMLEVAQVSKGDYLIDLGSGDGRIVITAAKKYGIRGFGVDLNPERVREARANAKEAGVADSVAFYERDLFATDLSPATVITMYLLPRVNLELRPRLLELKPGTRIVSHDFSMEDWKPDVHVTVDTPDKYGGHGGKSDVYFWVVPAKADGNWRWQLHTSGKQLQYEVAIEQKFQEISGTARVGGHTAKLRDAKLRGSEISFVFTAPVDGAPVTHRFSGKIENDAISGTARLSGARIEGQHDWSAQRVAKRMTKAYVPRID